MQYTAAIFGLGFVGAGDELRGLEIGFDPKNTQAGTHLDALQNSERIKLIGGSSRDEGRRERFTEKTGLKAYKDWQDLLVQLKPDIVCIASTAPSHAEMTLGCAVADVKAVLCEKPISTNLLDADSMVSGCKRLGTLLVVNLNRRFIINYREAAQFISEGKLGKLESAHLVWPQGRLVCTGSHMIAALCMLTGQKVKSVSFTLAESGRLDCRGSEYNDPGGWGMFRMSGELWVTVDAHEDGESLFTTIITGELGTMVVSANTAGVVYPAGGSLSFAKDHPLTIVTVIEEIVGCLDRGDANILGPENAVHSLEVAVACHKSSHVDSAWVSLPVDVEDRSLVINAA